MLFLDMIQSHNRIVHLQQKSKQRMYNHKMYEEMNKAKFTRNAFGIQVKKCCASCAHKQLNRTVSQRVCAKHNKEVRACEVCECWKMSDINKEVRACEVCECWKMSDMLKSFCMSEGQIKRREYQLYLLKIREREAEIDVEEEQSIEDIRKEFESQFGSIYINL